MKKSIILLLLFIGTAAVAQVDRSKLPEPAPAKEIKIGDYEKFTLKNGLNVILVENHKLPTIGWTLTFDTGPILEADKAGYLGVFGQVLRAGTTTKTKAILDEEIDFMGASVSAGSNSISAFSLSKYKEEVLSIMSDLLFNPSFPQDEFERAIEQNLTGIKASQENANAISANVSGVLNYGADHPYGELITEETLKNVELSDLKKHYDKFFKPEIAYLVIVGDINKRDAQKLVKNYFGKWESGSVTKEEFPAVDPIEKSVIAIVDRPSAVQSVINITYPMEKVLGNPDAEKITVMNQILGGGSSARLFTNLREDKGYTYGAYANINTNPYTATFSANASVRNEVTDSSMVEFMYELRRIRDELVTQEELDLAKNFLRGQFARSLESRGTLASFALNASRFDLSDDYYANYLKRIDAVTLDDVKAAAQKYIRPDQANIVIVGKAEEIAGGLRSLGEVKFFDEEGNEVDDPTKEVVSDMTPETILSKYVDAIGGLDALNAVNTLEYKSEAELNIQGQTLSISRTVYQKSPDKYLDLTVIPLQGEVRQIYNGGTGKMQAQGQTLPLQGPQLNTLKYLGVLFAERFYKDLGYELSYKGLKKVDGKDAHRIDVTIEGLTVSEFYDAETGLKVRADLGQSGVYNMSDYKAVDGVMIPHKLVVNSPAIPVPLELIIKEAKVNAEMDDSLFN